MFLESTFFIIIFDFLKVDWNMAQVTLKSTTVLEPKIIERQLEETNIDIYAFAW